MYSQTKVLEMPVSGQYRNNWCWNADVQMILKWYNIEKNQCEIYKTIDSRIDQSIISNCTCDLDCNSEASPCYSNTLPICFGDDSSLLNYNRIFRHFNINSVQEKCENIPWNIVKQNIDSGWPLILTTFRGFSNQLNSEHSVVVKGYSEVKIKFQTLKYLIINDPWSNCEGCTYLVNFDQFLDSNGTIKQIQAWAYNIYPLDQTLIPKPSEINCISNDNFEDYPVNSIDIYKLSKPIFENFGNCVPFEGCFDNSFSKTQKLTSKNVIELSLNDILNNFNNTIKTTSASKIVFPNSKKVSNCLVKLMPLRQKDKIQELALESNSINLLIPNDDFYTVDSFGEVCSFLENLQLLDQKKSRINFQNKNKNVNNFFRKSSIITIPDIHSSFNLVYFKNKPYCYSLIDIPKIKLKANVATPLKEVLISIKETYSKK